jgi:hypothetical protein
VNQITTAPSTATVVAGGGSLGGVTISNVAITDSTFANVLSGDTAVSSAGGFVRITGTGFKTGANVFLGSTVLANTFVDSTRINANIPATAAGNYQFTVFNTDGSGAISPAGLLISGPPSWTTTSYTSGSLTLGIQLLASGDAPLTYYIQPGSANPQNLAVNSAGYLSGTVSAEGSYTVTVVVDDAQGQSTQADITTTISLTDPYFNLTTLALSADTNVWITDASTNRFVATLQADVRPLAFSPYKTSWSNFFSGTSDYLRADAALSSITSTSQSWTVECWVYPLVAGSSGPTTDDYIIGMNTIASGANEFLIGLQNIYVNGSASALTSPIGSRQWTHVAAVYNGSTLKVYINGVLSNSFNETVGPLNLCVFGIGVEFDAANGGTPSNYFNGYISNLRFVADTEVYTANFTPPTSPLTAIANTSLLTCQSNRFIDNSTNNFTITKAGDPTVSNFGPFDETDTTTGSGFFDGTGDRIEFANDVALQMGTGSFTIEAWVYSTASQSLNSGIVAKGAASTGFTINVTGTTVAVAQGGTASLLTSASGAVPLNAWTHVAYVRSGTTIYLFVNGIQVDTGTSSYDLTETNLLRIGANRTNGAQFQGYISNVRVIKGTALYTSNFTPSTTLFTAVANTSLLTLQYPVGENNHRFVDSSGFNHLVTRNGNATQGTYSPFSQTGWSNYFDGSGDFLSLADNAALNPGTSDFVMEAWVYITAPTGNNQGFNGKGTAGTDGYSFFMTNDRVLSFVWNGTGGATITGGTLNLNQWHHIAVVRNSNVIRLYLDGTGAGSSTACTTDITSTATKFVGQARGGNPILGYMSNYRMIKGSRPATYNATSLSLTVPTSPLTAISGTSLLTCQSNRFIDNSTNAFAITRNGDTIVQAFSPFAPDAEYSAATNGGSAYFDGTGDNLTQASGQQVSFGTGNFTIEAWIYWTTSIASESAIMWGNGVGWTLYVFPANRLQWGTTTPQTPANLRTGNTTLVPGQWYHIAVTRSGTTVTLWVNGVSDGTVTDSANYSANGTLDIGISHSSNYFTGYMSGVRVIKGTALYTSTFTPPTTPPTPIVNTSLLHNFTNAGIIDATGKNILETVNQAQLSNVDKKYGTGSILFDGTDDHVVMPYSQNYTFATGPFTIECWVKFNTLSGNRLIFDTYTSAATGGGYQLYWRGTGTSIAFYANGGVQAQSSFTGHTTGTWYHVAVTRNTAGTLQIFIDGVSYASVSYATAIDIAASARPAIGIQFTTLTNDLDGYIDDLRVTKGFARYTANFAPPTATFKLR